MSRTDLHALLGEALWAAIHEAGMTQGEAAFVIGCTQKHLSQAVNGKSGSIEFYENAVTALGRGWRVFVTDRDQDE